MPNLRILSDNAANRATLSAQTTAGNLVVANLLSDIKSDIYRSIGNYTNQLASIYDFTTASWTKTGTVTVTAAAKIAPDGTLTGQLITDNDTVNPALVGQFVSPFNMAGNLVTASIFVSQGTATKSTLNCYSATDVGTNSFITWLNGIPSVTLGTIVQSVNGWWLWSITLTTVAAQGFYFRLFPCDSNTNSQTGTIYAWGASVVQTALANITANWTLPENISCVILPFTNLGQNATMRVQLGNVTVGDVYDSGALPACPAIPINIKNFFNPTNSYGYGGGSYASMWLPATYSAKILTVTLQDINSTTGYVEASRLVCGTYWEPKYNAAYGAQIAFNDLSKHFRSDAGDLLTDVGTRYRKVNLNLEYMPNVDKNALVNILRGNGIANPLLLSVFPQNADNELERDFMLYGKLSQIGAMNLPFVNVYTAPIDFEEI